MSYSCNVAGVSNCYVFKSRLQEFAQKVGLSTPVYETTKEGPSHEPTFRSTVIVSNERYDSLPGFFNRKAAEQSAAEVALMQLVHNGEVANCISQPVVMALFLSLALFINFLFPTCNLCYALWYLPLLKHPRFITKNCFVCSYNYMKKY